MSVRSRRRQRLRGEKFGAPWGRAVKWTTGCTISILVGIIVAPRLVLYGKLEPWWVYVIPSTIVVIGLGVVFLFSVRGFVIKERELWIERPLWQTRLELDDLQCARVDPLAMKGSWRTLGNGGLLAFTGWFRNSRLGKYRAFVTDQARCVVMEFEDRKVVVSPEDPERFVNLLGFETDSNRTGP